jgi:hypothetical protein
MRIVNKTFTEWLDEQPDYGLCDPPMKAQMAIDYLFDYLDVPPISMPENCEQCNTAILYFILYKYSKKFRKEVKRYAKRRANK